MEEIDQLTLPVQSPGLPWVTHKDLEAIVARIHTMQTQIYTLQQQITELQKNSQMSNGQSGMTVKSSNSIIHTAITDMIDMIHDKH